jgi:hypothetical protein
MIFLIARRHGVFHYQGQSYELSPIAYPAVDMDQILVVNNSLARSICEEHSTNIAIARFEVQKIPGFPKPLECPPHALPPGKKLMLLRGGGIGDLIMLTPALKTLRRMCGDRIRLHLSTFANRHPLFDDLPFIDRLFPHPIRLSEFIQHADYYVEFSDPKQIFNHINMTDFHLDSLHIDLASIPASDKRPMISSDLAKSEDMKAHLNEHCPPGRMRVLCSLGGSDRIRDLPPVILDTIAAQYTDILFLVTGNIPHNNTLSNITALDTSRGLDAFVTAINECDFVLSTDSSAYHIAAALNKPALTFFGPIASALRSTYYPKLIPVDANYTGETCTSPCGISSITETPPEIAIGANQVRSLQAGIAITTYAGKTFAFDPHKGCPEANALNTPYSPCLSFPRDTILEGFKRLLALR